MTVEQAAAKRAHTTDAFAREETQLSNRNSGQPLEMLRHAVTPVGLHYLLIHFDIVNRASPIVNRVYTALSRLMEPLLRPIRRFLVKHLPDIGGIDLSPLILLLLLNFIDSALHSWFYTY